VRFRYVIGPDGSVDVSDRGLAYGDGLFETMAIRRGQVQRFDLHYKRLLAGCARLEIPAPEADELTAQIAAARVGVVTGSLKLILTRGSGPRGYAPPPQPSPMVILAAASDATSPAANIKVASLRQRLAENEALAGIKHLCRLEQVLGQIELRNLQADEGLLHSRGGRVIGGTSRNLFAAFGDKLVTPELTRCGIRGVMRHAVLSACTELGIQHDEREILPAELAAADELFMTNALVGIQSVTSLDGRAIRPGPLAGRLREALGLEQDE
jgi:4-amino-4-deoxychorismate lyase